MRATKFRSKPSNDFASTLELLANTTFFLVARNGPSVFSVKDEADNILKVVLGNPHKCNCGSNSTFDDPCIHILFCLQKVLKLPQTHPLIYQTSLTDAELDQVLSGTFAPRERRRIPTKPKKEKKEETILTDSFVTRQPLNEEQEETCPICQDEMISTQPLSWCRKGCGNNIHAKCMLKFVQYKISNKQSPSCPLCREDWDLTLLRSDCREKTKSSAPCNSVHCSRCRCLQRDFFYRCLECSQSAFKSKTKPVDFCGECFQHINDVHATHHFLTSQVSEDVHDTFWKPCKNPSKSAINHSINPQMLLELQQRELTNEDYELLLTFDGAPLPALPKFCIDSLPNAGSNKLKINSVKRTCWCSNHSYGESMRSEKVKALPCGHLAHDNCLEEELSALVSEDSSRLAQYRCSHSDCGKVLFGGLNRIRNKKVKYAPTEEQKPENGKKSSGSLLAESSLSVMPNLAGLNVVGNSSVPGLMGSAVSTFSAGRSVNWTGAPEGVVTRGNLSRLNKTSRLRLNRIQYFESQENENNASTDVNRDGVDITVAGSNGLLPRSYSSLSLPDQRTEGPLMATPGGTDENRTPISLITNTTLSNRGIADLSLPTESRRDPLLYRQPSFPSVDGAAHEASFLQGQMVPRGGRKPGTKPPRAVGRLRLRSLGEGTDSKEGTGNLLSSVTSRSMGEGVGGESIRLPPVPSVKTARASVGLSATGTSSFRSDSTAARAKRDKFVQSFGDGSRGIAVSARPLQGSNREESINGVALSETVLQSNSSGLNRKRRKFQGKTGFGGKESPAFGELGGPDDGIDGLLCVKQYN